MRRKGGKNKWRVLFVYLSILYFRIVCLVVLNEVFFFKGEEREKSAVTMAAALQGSNSVP